MSADLQWETISYSDEGEVVFIEIIPTDGHEEGTSECWCEPDLMMNCVECEDTGTACWRCGGRGLVEYEHLSDRVPVAVHHDDRLD